ncbi:MAG: hypothetical protein QW292_02990 [Candidatus Parvarchaeota archaeon]
MTDINVIPSLGSDELIIRPPVILRFDNDWELYDKPFKSLDEVYPYDKEEVLVPPSIEEVSKNPSLFDNFINSVKSLNIPNKILETFIDANVKIKTNEVDAVKIIDRMLRAHGLVVHEELVLGTWYPISNLLFNFRSDMLYIKLLNKVYRCPINEALTKIKDMGLLADDEYKELLQLYTNIQIRLNKNQPIQFRRGLR